MAYAIPKPNPQGEKVLMTMLRARRHWSHLLSKMDLQIPGLKAIITRYIALLGDAPLPPGFEFLSTTAEGRRRAVKANDESVSLIEASLLEGFYCYEVVKSAPSSLAGQRNAFFYGLFRPLIYCFQQGQIPTATSAEGMTWSLLADTVFQDFASGSSSFTWTIQSGSAVDPLYYALPFLKRCIEPEYPHWHDPLLQEIFA